MEEDEEYYEIEDFFHLKLEDDDEFFDGDDKEFFDEDTKKFLDGMDEILIEEDITVKEEYDWDRIYDFAFLALRLLDKATLFSKKEVMNEYEKNKNAKNLEELLLTKSIYPNGKRLGFYNISKYSLEDILNRKFDEKWQKLYEDSEKEVIKNDPKLESEEFFYEFFVKIEFEQKLKEQLEYEKYQIFQKKIKEDFFEYIKGFNTEVQAFFDVIKYSQRFTSALENNMHKSVISEPIDSEEDIVNFVIKYLKYYELDKKYVDYEDLNDFLIKTLFEGIEFKEETSIFQINPQSPSIISCFDYIKSKNPECDVNLYAIIRNPFIAYSLKFLSIVKKINFKYLICEYYNTPQNREVYAKFFGKINHFDFVIQSDIFIDGSGITDLGYAGRNADLSLYGVQVSSRLIDFDVPTGFLFTEDDLKEDFLESLILIPYMNTINWQYETFSLVLLTIHNFNKKEQRKNKFLVVDKNQNYDLTTREISLEDYSNLIKSSKLYEDSYTIFSKFSNSDFSKLFSIERMIDSSEDGIIHFDINDRIYDIKMKSQNKYFEIEYFEGKNRIKENLNYPIEKLKNLIITPEDAKIDGLELDNETDYLYWLYNEKEGKQFIFYDFEIGDEISYEKFALISDKVSLEYLYHYLNSELAKNEYKYFLRGNVNRRSINKIRVPIPPKEIQEKIVAAMDKRDDFLNDVQLLKTITNKNFFDYERNMKAIDEFYGKIKYSAETQDLDVPDNWAYTYSGLIWPLAVTYLIASGGYSKTEKYNNLIRLLEFTVAFNSYVLMSGLPKEIYEEEKADIWSIAYANPNRKDKLKNKLPLGFGSWAFFHGTLAGIYKKEFNTKIDKDFYMGLLDKDIRKTYDNLADERNNYFHGSIKNEEECGTLLNQLNPTKLKIFNYLNSCYKSYKLYYVAKKPELYEINDGIMTFEYTMMYLNGPYSMPIYANVLSEEILDNESLYLQDVAENKFTKIDDRLIKFKSLDENKRDWRLYVFIGFEKHDGKKQAKYRCYQRPEEDIYEDIDLNELM